LKEVFWSKYQNEIMYAAAHQGLVLLIYHRLHEETFNSRNI